jgi:hypothetical protein
MLLVPREDKVTEKISSLILRPLTYTHSENSAMRERRVELQS